MIACDNCGKTGKPLNGNVTRHRRDGLPLNWYRIIVTKETSEGAPVDVQMADICSTRCLHQWADDGTENDTRRLDGLARVVK